MTWKSLEVAPGITRIESILGPRPFSQYLLHDERSMLVDTGVKETPADVILPALDGARGRLRARAATPTSTTSAVTAAIHEAMPGRSFCAHCLDTPWIEDAELIMRERYGWYDAFGVGYDPDTAAWLANAMGPSHPIDVQLQGGEVFRLGPQLSVEILSLPGHSHGHVGVWEPRSRTAIIMDAVLARGLLDTEGRVIHPPPIVDVAGYERSVRLLQELDPARLLTGHYDVIQGDDVGRFLDESLAFVARAREFVSSSPDVPLAELLAGADAELGPFTSMPNELAATLRSVLLDAGQDTARMTASPLGSHNPTPRRQ